MLRWILLSVYVVLLSSLIPQCALAQKVASYDFTHETLRERSRPPLPSPPPPAMSGAVLVGPLHSPPVPAGSVRGVCGGTLGDPPLAVSISLDRDSYTVGDEFLFTLRLDALHPTWIPIRVSIADVEPSDPSRSYKWRPMYINMELSTADKQEAGMRLLTLYGSSDTPRSEIALKRGEWVEMRGKARMEWGDPRQGSPSYVTAVPRQGPRQFSAIARETRQGSFWYDVTTKQEDQLCDFPAEESRVGPPAYFMLSPKASPR